VEGSAQQLYLAFVGLEQTCQQFDEGGLARPIEAQQPHNFAPIQTQAHPPQHLARGIRFMQIAYLYNRVVGRRRVSW